MSRGESVYLLGLRFDTGYWIDEVAICNILAEGERMNGPMMQHDHAVRPHGVVTASRFRINGLCSGSPFLRNQFFVKRVDKLDPPSPPDHADLKFTIAKGDHHRLLRSRNTRSSLRFYGHAYELTLLTF
jgi:hypothetical protein